MTRNLRWLAAVLLAVMAFPMGARAESREDARLVLASQVLEDLRKQPDQNIPQWLMQRAYGVAVIPNVIQGALIFGGRGGAGVMSVRDASGRFTNPVFVSLAGGSVGWQIGAQAADVVLIFATQRSIDYFKRGDFTLGATASLTAGPVGRQTEAAAGMNSEVYAYSRTRGLFAGVSISGTVLGFAKRANRNFYGPGATDVEAVSSGKVTTSDPTAARLLAAIGALAADAASSSAADSNPPPAAPATPASYAPAPATAPADAGTRTYPLEDPKPGSEPN
ncbi:MAG TPA: lipid-binding SYLF domain-containing protein [Steroidobacteraceae bacterium]|nr:lipid-binding SYLF domain-containing protein [Steroidobacteraceae bacterium]